MKQTDICTFVIISRSGLLRMRKVADGSCTENQNTFCVQFFFSEIVLIVR